MAITFRNFKSFRRFGLACVAAGAFAGSADFTIAAQPPGKGQATDDKKLDIPLTPVPVSVNTLSLGECLAIGAEKQPAIQAALISLRSAESGAAALNNLNRAAGLIAPDLPFRKQQTCSGIAVAQADVAKAIQENRYDIIRMYFSFVYARQQDATAADIVVQLKVYYGVAAELAKEPGTGIDKFKLFAMEEAINEVQKLRITARTGQSMALAALKEAMGVEQTFDFLPRDQELPIMGGTVTEQQVVGLAQTNRPELAMAAAGVDAFRLEICAQNAIKYKQKVMTLAGGSDLHARQVPMPHRNGEYRPGALAPEMPALLVGSRTDRVQRATDLSARQDTLYDKTQQLVTLEAVNAYHNWAAATERMKLAKSRYESGKEMAKLARENAPLRKDQDNLIRTEALAGKAQADYIEAVFEHIKQHATLERVTGGGIKSSFPEK